MERVPKIQGQLPLGQRAIIEDLRQAEELRKAPELRAGAPGASSASAPPPLARTSISFRVDPDMDDITVIVSDAETGQVLRTIPPEELARLVAQMKGPGGLLLEDER